MAFFVGLGWDWKSEIRTGLFYSALFILVNLLIPQLTIGFPYTKYASFSTDFLPVVVFAPVVEELIFRFFLLNALWYLRLTPMLIVGMTAATFSLFHWAAYGASFEAQNASFVGAFLFGLIVAWIAIKRRSFIIPMIIHAVFNAWLIAKIYVFT